MEPLRKTMIRDPLIWKFCAYGFLKNLKFFEPYLVIYLLGMGQDLFSIGILYSIREGITWLFEIPSGVLADNYGKKKELMTCFLFYILSFLLFFRASGFPVLVAAMIFFGLGEAFRSGTHKAMIYSYLERKGWFHEKTFVYGRTRSFSLLGSSLSAFLSILFVVNLPALRWIFLICTVPYILDFILIWSYPEYLDEKHEAHFSFRSFVSLTFERLYSVARRPVLRKILFSSALFDGIFRTIKDYIQPILILLFLSAITVKDPANSEKVVKIYLGILYGIFYIFSSMASRNVYRLHGIWTSSSIMNYSFVLLGLMFIGLSFSIHIHLPITVMGIYFLIYVMKDGRRPIFMDLCGNWMEKKERATVMSLDSQLRSVVTIIAAPAAGWLAETFSIGTMFLVLGLVILITERLAHINEESAHVKY
jgi:predicted MFS family arabinose efflux permease